MQPKDFVKQGLLLPLLLPQIILLRPQLYRPELLLDPPFQVQLLRRVTVSLPLEHLG